MSAAWCVIWSGPRRAGSALSDSQQLPPPSSRTTGGSSGARSRAQCGRDLYELHASARHRSVRGQGRIARCRSGHGPGRRRGQARDKGTVPPSTRGRVRFAALRGGANRGETEITIYYIGARPKDRCGRGPSPAQPARPNRLSPTGSPERAWRPGGGERELTGSVASRCSARRQPVTSERRQLHAAHAAPETRKPGPPQTRDNPMIRLLHRESVPRSLPSLLLRADQLPETGRPAGCDRTDRLRLARRPGPPGGGRRDRGHAQLSACPATPAHRIR